MSGRYASNTSVSVEKSQAEIQQTLARYGVEDFGVFTRGGLGSVVFAHRGLTIQINVPLPARGDAEFTTTDTGRERSGAQAVKVWEQACKSRWRALLLAIKAKLEAVEAGISSIEHEFMPFIVMPDGRALHEHLTPQLERYAASGQMPQLLALPEGRGSDG